MCHALDSIYDGSRWGKGWVCGTTKGGCSMTFDLDDPAITKQDGSAPPEHIQADAKESAALSAELTKMGADASTEFQNKWSKKLKIGSFHLLSLRQLVIMQRILDLEPAYIAAKKEKEHERQGAETF